MIEGTRMRVSVRLGSSNVGKLCPATNLSVASIGVYSGDGPLVNAVRTISGKRGARTHHHHRSLHIGGSIMCEGENGMKSSQMLNKTPNEQREG